MRFTLSKLFLAVAMLALACAGMIYRNRWWADGIVTFTFLLYAVTALRAVRLHARERTFAVAFAAVGTAYLALFQSPARENLCTNYPLTFIARTLEPSALCELPSPGRSQLSYS